MKAFVMPDEDFDTQSEEGRNELRKAIVQSARRADYRLVPNGGAKGGVGKGRIVHNNMIHNVK